MSSLSTEEENVILTRSTRNRKRRL
jgi:hypothetical protein